MSVRAKAASRLDIHCTPATALTEQHVSCQKYGSESILNGLTVRQAALL